MPAPARKRMVVGLVLLAVVILMVVGVLAILHYRTYHLSTDDAFIDGVVYEISPRISGKVAAVLVTDNERVEAGQLLVRLDPEPLEAELRVAEESLQVAINDTAARRAALAAAQAQVRQAGAQLELSRKEKQRTMALAAQGAASQQDADRWQAQLRSTGAAVTAAEEQVRQISAALGPEGPDGNVATVRLAQSRRALAALQLTYAVIAAPRAGVVTRKNVEPGDVLQAGQTVLALVDLEGLYVTANYKETQLERMRPGQRVRIDVDTYPGAELEGRVDSVMAGTGSVFSLIPPENATGNYIKVVQRVPVKIVFTGDEWRKLPLRLGLSVVPTVLVED